MAKLEEKICGKAFEKITTSIKILKVQLLTCKTYSHSLKEKREKKEKFENTGIGSKIIYDEADLLIMGILDSSCKNGPNSAQSSFSKMYSTPDNIRDISDILEIEFDVKTEDSDTVDGSDPYNSNGNHGGIISHEDLNMEYSTSANLGIPTDELHNDCHDDVHTAYESQPTHSNYDPNGHENSDATNNDTLQQPKIVSTSSLSAISRAASIRKSAYSALRTGMGSRKRPASYMLNNSGIGNGISRDRELTDLKCRKIRAELDLLQRETYKKDLEILQLERSLGLPASNITKKFYRFNNRTNSSIIANNK